MNRIAQCVPNISEGRDQNKIDFIIEPLRTDHRFKFISAEPDKDYNRTVITLLGDPEMMMTALLEFFKRAKDSIDMNLHHGEHPRMGAVDVCPFIPISNITIEECVEYAKKLAEQVSSLQDIPVFLYAKAAQDPSRINLPDIRKGEFEGMIEKIKDPFWKPDFGPAHIHHTFGTVAIGARIPLVAFNIDLPTLDEKIASNIAKTIRQSSGGFQHIQAGPATLIEKGHVQVTMNILDFKKNPIYRILETVKMEAQRYQLEVKTTEIIGLLPKEAVTDSLKYYYAVHQLTWDKNISMDELTIQAIKYLKFRDFGVLKIIEANI